MQNNSGHMTAAAAIIAVIAATADVDNCQAFPKGQKLFVVVRAERLACRGVRGDTSRQTRASMKA